MESKKKKNFSIQLKTTFHSSTYSSINSVFRLFARSLTDRKSEISECMMIFYLLVQVPSSTSRAWSRRLVMTHCSPSEQLPEKPNNPPQGSPSTRAQTLQHLKISSVTFNTFFNIIFRVKKILHIGGFSF